MNNYEKQILEDFETGKTKKAKQRYTTPKMRPFRCTLKSSAAEHATKTEQYKLESNATEHATKTEQCKLESSAYPPLMPYTALSDNRTLQ